MKPIPQPHNAVFPLRDGKQLQALSLGRTIGRSVAPPTYSKMEDMPEDSEFIGKYRTGGVLSEHPRVRFQFAPDGGVDLQQRRGGRTVERLRPTIVEQPPIDGAHDMTNYFRFHFLFLFNRRSSEHFAHRHRREGVIYGLHLFGSQTDVGGSDILFQPAQVARSGNRHDPRTFVHHPC